MKTDDWGKLLVRGFPRDGDSNSSAALVADPDGNPTIRASARNPEVGEVRLVPYGSASSSGIPTSTEALSRWRERKLIDAIRMRPNFATRVASMLQEVDFETKQGKFLYNKLVDEAHEIAATGLAADRGTHAHRISEIVDTEGVTASNAFISRGEELGFTEEQQRRYADSWQEFTRTLGLEVLGIEQVVVNDQLRKAGTFDRLYRTTRQLTFRDRTIPAGTVIVGDLKTSNKLYFTTKAQNEVNYQAEHSAQLAVYAGGVPYDAVSRTRDDWPEPPSREYGVIMHGQIDNVIEKGAEGFNLWFLDLELGKNYVDASNDLKVAEKAAERAPLLTEVTDD